MRIQAAGRAVVVVVAAGRVLAKKPLWCSASQSFGVLVLGVGVEM